MPEYGQGVIGASQIADGSITTPKLADDAVTTDKIDDETIATGDIANLAINAAKLATNAVETAKINANNVTFAKLSASIQKASFEQLASTTLGAAAATVTFDSIPSSYKRLRLLMDIKTDTASYQLAKIILNDDTASTYVARDLQAVGTTLTAGDYSSTVGFRINACENNTANSWSRYIVEIEQRPGAAYALINTNWAHVNSLNKKHQVCGWWPVTDSISKIVLGLDGNNYEAGSKFSLEGAYE